MIYILQSPVNPSNTSYDVHQVGNRPEAVTCRPNVLGSLEKVFKWLGFDVQIHRDCDGKKLQSLFVELGKKDHRLMDCLVCCVLTHGEEGVVYGVDGSPVKIKNLMLPFDGQRCPSLLEKPKLFFIQACQGNKEQPRVQTDGTEDETSNVFSDAKITIESIPSAADFLVGMATVPEYVSFRDRKLGTWYIQSLCRNLVMFVPRLVTTINRSDANEKLNLFAGAS
ncbi:hypothetical protein GOODEAATRI_013933 [Goodea atripinnis]|uniref:Caspase-8 n=1 Tax=Goodea atripinnis TaxID=208336 RepID=A0ABV0PDW9_9TELE